MLDKLVLQLFMQMAIAKHTVGIIIRGCKGPTDEISLSSVVRTLCQEQGNQHKVVSISNNFF